MWVPVAARFWVVTAEFSDAVIVMHGLIMHVLDMQSLTMQVLVMQSLIIYACTPF